MRTQIKVDGNWIDGAPQLNEWYKQQVGTFPNGDPVWQEQRFTPQSLSDAKTESIAKVNPEARRRIEALDWQVTRATEQPELYSLPDVLATRQAIRDASNKAKVDISALTIIEDVEAFTW